MRKRRYTYPDNWKQISHEVRERAGWKCQQCGAPHKTYIYRFLSDPSIWVLAGVDNALTEGWSSMTYNIISAHHIGVLKPDGSPGDSRDKSDCRPENLIALCARCHLMADLEVSKKHAIETKRDMKHQRARAAGQLELF